MQVGGFKYLHVCSCDLSVNILLFPHTQRSHCRCLEDIWMDGYGAHSLISPLTSNCNCKLLSGVQAHMTAVLWLMCATAYLPIASWWLRVCRTLPRCRLITAVQLSCSIAGLGCSSMNRSMQNFRSLLNGNFFACFVICLFTARCYMLGSLAESTAIVLVVRWLSVGLVIERSLVRLPARALSSQLGQLSLPSFRGR